MAELKTKSLNVSGMDCADCALHIEKEVSGLHGVKDAKVDFMQAKLKVTFDPVQSSLPDIEKAVRTAGYSLEKHEKTFFTTLIVKGMDCADEARPIETALRKLDGVRDVKFNLISNKLTVEHIIPIEEIQRTLKKIGFESELAGSEAREAKTTFWREHKMFLLSVSSGVFLLGGMLLERFQPAGFWDVWVFLLSILTGGLPIARKGWKEARNFTLGINFLMTIAVIGAMTIGQWSEGAAVVFLFSLAQWLESRSMERARQSIQSLMSLAPKTALVKTAEGVETRQVEEIGVGSIIIIRPGDLIPLDGEVVAGSSRVDQAPITGESIPVKKKPDESVYAGTINQKGTLEIRVTRKSGDTTLAKIVHLVEEAQSRKAPSQSFVEKFARYYTPAVVILAVLLATVPPLFLGASFAAWFYRALVLLVVSCPCALVISTPVTIVSALTNAARNGILIKGGVHLETFDKMNAIALDKTGTLTVGKPQVIDIIVFNDVDKTEILTIAASIEARSEHLLGQAIVNEARAGGLPFRPIDNFEAITGKGVRASLNGITYFIGNHRLFEENGWCREEIHPDLEGILRKNQTAVLVGNSKKILGLISIADAVRPGAAGAIQQLKKAGIRKTVMLTGDNRRTATAVAEEIGLDENYPELLPEDKVTILEKLSKESGGIVMVGDGINDAPALAAADVGIAMGASGTDTALETADIALMKDDLKKLIYLKQLSKKSLRIIKENIWSAILIKAIFIFLTIPGWATLWMAVFADMGASLIVIFNGLRALRRWSV